MSKTANKPNEEPGAELTNFQWDDEKNFFGITSLDAPSEEETTEEEVVEEEVVEEKEKKPKKKTTETSTEEPEEEEKEGDNPKKKNQNKEVPFSQTEEAEEETEEDEEFFTNLTVDLKERGILKNVEVKKGEKVTEDQFFDLQDAEIESRVEEAIGAFMEEVSDDGKAFLKYIKAGGKANDFFRQMADVTMPYDEIDFTKESDQDEFLAWYYKNVEGMDQDDITDKLEWLKEAGGDKKKKYAEKYFNKVSNIEKQRKDALVKAKEKQNQARIDAYNEFSSQVTETLQQVDEVSGIAFTAKDKKELAKFITKSTNDLGISDLYYAVKKLHSEKDKSKLLLLAKLIKSDFDFTDLVKEARTQTAKQIKSNLNSQKNGSRPTASGNTRDRSLADYFGK